MWILRGEAGRYLIEILVAAGAALLVYRLSQRQPGRLPTAGARLDAFVARRTALVVSVIALLPILLRLAVLPWVPAPLPRIHDEFGHLLVGDTLAHGRLANPPHPLARHLETIYVLQRPTYASKYPIGQGVILALGQVATGVPWAGVLLATGLMCGAITWMLLGCLPAGWAALGGVLAFVTFGLPHGWVDTLWGGAFAAAGGAVLLGALLRLDRAPTPGLGLAAGLGGGIVWLCRPYESTVLLAVSWAFLSARAARDRPRRRAWGRALAVFGAAQLGVLALTALHNQAVTGSFTTLPYLLSQRTYGVPQRLIVQPPADAPGLATPEQADMYRLQRETWEAVRAQPLRHARRIAEMAWEFYVKAWLSVPVLVGLLWPADRVGRLCATLLAGAFLTSALYGSFNAHYWAAYGGVFMLLAIRGARRVQRWAPSGRPVGQAAVALFVAGALTGVLHGVPLGPILGITDYGYVMPLRHRVAARLRAIDGLHVVFVKYGPTHSFQDEWVYNAADVDAARIVWVRALDAENDARVVRYYGSRRIWRAEAEGDRVRVTGLRAPAGSRASDAGWEVSEEWVLTAGGAPSAS